MAKTDDHRRTVIDAKRTSSYYVLAPAPAFEKPAKGAKAAA